MRKLATIIVVMMMICGCVDTEIKNTLHPDSAEVSLSVDVSAGGDYAVVVDGIRYEVVDGVAQFSDYFMPGSYTFFVFNDADGVTMDYSSSAVVASVEVVEGAICSNPGTLLFGSKQLSLSADELYTFNVPLSQITAQIDFELTLSGSAFEDLKSEGGIETRLDGISQKWDCVGDCMYGDSGYAQPELSQMDVVSVARSGGVASMVVGGEMTLLGVDSSKEQILTIVLNYVDGSNVTIESDVSSQLATLNQNKTKIITLSGEYETSVSGEVEGAVIDWVVVDESDDILDLY